MPIAEVAALVMKVWFALTVLQNVVMEARYRQNANQMVVTNADHQLIL